MSGVTETATRRQSVRAASGGRAWVEETVRVLRELADELEWLERERL
jgi:hypothetical protein